MATTATTLNVTNIYDAFSSGVSTAATSLSNTINAASNNANDPVNMIQMQRDLANYTLALQVQSAVIKSIEETAKSITQKL